ncbi:LPXTG cell wall anchor domain-containing protein [Enterococcus casseliflavus]|uniref:LPXTG cell wall anchor domain-containing protein n=1 Tax=Enterococcus casseliflavus TaxID=37734 RepID=UPI002DBF5EDD|nr:LPXTG cell wall anchor domain-containing protein [Enterococcus casseliflavus]MEB8416385.1 LPXTG cell wall anchor domain-containing protein [Enterococcus casseliflavus]
MKHKKFTMILLLFLGVFLLQSSTMIFAAMTDSKETDVAVELRETIAPDKDLPGVENVSAESDIVPKRRGVLPKTGEIMNHGYSWLGGALVLFGSTLYYSKKIVKGRD